MSQKKLEIAIIIGIVVNVILTLIKLIFGYMGHAQALITDGYNSLSDVLMSSMIYFVLRISNKAPDDDHPYGHHKFEGVVYFALGMIFMLSALLLFVSTGQQLIDYLRQPQGVTGPTFYTIIVSVIALVIKLFLAGFYHLLYKRTKHSTLKAESRNHAIDMIATSFTLIGIGLAHYGFIIFDYIAALIIVFLIFRLALSTLKEAVSFLVDQSPEQTIVDDMNEYISHKQGVLSVDVLKMRKHMTKIYMDVEIGVEPTLSLKAAHEIAERVHDAVEHDYPEVIHCMIHVNPHE